MKSIRALLADRRRSQRGSILSGVLIITAFLAIISGALMTELSTNFLLSSKLVNRVATEATINSAAEMAISRLQDTQTSPLFNGCPSLGATTLNGMVAVSTYAACVPVIDARSPQGFRSVASGGGFNVDGTQVVLGAAGVDEYLALDNSGNLFATRTGQSSQSWSVALGGEATASPAGVLDSSTSPADVSYLVPVVHPSNPGCGAANACVALLSGQGASRPTVVCFMPASGQVTSAAAAGANFPGIAYFGDANGNLFAYDSGRGNGCAEEATTTVPNSYSVVAGPYAFKGPAGQTNFDEIYVVVSNGTTGALMHFTFSKGKKGAGLQWVSTVPLPGVPVGVAVESSTLPARLAISFASGMAAIAQIASSFAISSVATAPLPAGSSDAPFWCHCPGGASLIGFGANSGALYVLDTNLNLQGTYLGAAGVTTTPGADAGGDWFVAADDGTVTELQQATGSGSLVPVARYGSSGAITSAPEVTACPAGICVYFGSTDGNAYLVLLDARNAIVNTCISAAPPACTQGLNPRLWTRVEVGAQGSPQTVHVQGWSYYSP